MEVLVVVVVEKVMAVVVEVAIVQVFGPKIFGRSPSIRLVSR
jgi:hypothetical protein